MSSEPTEGPISLMQVIVRLIYNCITEGTNNYTTIIDILALVCLVSILSRHTSTTIATPANQSITQQTNPLQKVLGELSKGESPGPESLMSLLPLLNSPQVKSKLNPSTISTLLGLMSGIGGTDKSEKNDKSEKTPKTNKEAKDVADNSPKTTTASTLNSSIPANPPSHPSEEGAAAVTEAQILSSNPEPTQLPLHEHDMNHERKYTGKALNWKGNFST